MWEQNAAVVRRAVESIWNQGDLDLADRLFDSAYVNHGGVIPDMVYGPEAIKVSVAMYRTAFPQFSVTIDHLAADGDMVELCWAAHTQSGAQQPTAGPDIRHEELIGTTRCRLSEGQIIESWTTWDRGGVLRRLENIDQSDGSTGPGGRHGDDGRDG
ncbi:MAG: hypothetical protein NVS2B16_35650 [Chloroflexota bacterium]